MCRHNAQAQTDQYRHTLLETQRSQEELTASVDGVIRASFVADDIPVFFATDAMDSWSFSSCFCSTMNDHTASTESYREVFQMLNSTLAEYL